MAFIALRRGGQNTQDADSALAAARSHISCSGRKTPHKGPALLTSAGRGRRQRPVPQEFVLPAASTSETPATAALRSVSAKRRVAT